MSAASSPKSLTRIQKTLVVLDTTPMPITSVLAAAIKINMGTKVYKMADVAKMVDMLIPALEATID